MPNKMLQVRKYLRDDGIAGVDNRRYCAGTGCDFFATHTQFKADFWVKHVLSCSSWGEHEKAGIAAAHPKSKAAQLFIPPTPSWKRASIGGGDEDDGVGRRDSGDVGSGLCGEVDVGSSISPSPPKKLFKAGLMRVDWCDEKRADKINESIMRFLTGCALPFTIVESIFFIEMVTELNSAYIKFLPKRKTFRDKLAPMIYHQTIQAVSQMWAYLGNPFLSFAFDGFKTEASTHVVICTESSGNKTAFKACIDPGERREDANFYAEITEKQLRETAEAAKKPVSEVFTAVVGDNVSYNRLAFSILEVIFPTLFFFGCIAHCFSLLCQDITRIHEFAELIAAARAVTVFIKSHKYVQQRFQTIIARAGGANGCFVPRHSLRIFRFDHKTSFRGHDTLADNGGQRVVG